MVRVNAARNIDQRGGKTGAVPSVVFYLHAPTEECGQEEDHSKNNHGAQNDSIGNRRTGNFTNSGDQEWSGQEHQPHPNGAALFFFRVGIDPGEQLRHKENRGQREINNENQVPGGARPLERRPDHGAKGRRQVEQDVTQDTHSVDRAQRRERRRFPFSPVRKRARDTGEKQRPYRKHQQRMRDASVPSNDQQLIAGKEVRRTSESGKIAPSMSDQVMMRPRFIGCEANMSSPQKTAFPISAPAMPCVMVSIV